MEVKEPTSAYHVPTSTAQHVAMLRGKIIQRVEKEDDMHLLQQFYVYISDSQAAPNLHDNEKLRSLRGILHPQQSYQELRDDYLNEKFSL